MVDVDVNRSSFHVVMVVVALLRLLEGFLSFFQFLLDLLGLFECLLDCGRLCLLGRLLQLLLRLLHLLFLGLRRASLFSHLLLGLLQLLLHLLHLLECLLQALSLRLCLFSCLWFLPCLLGHFLGLLHDAPCCLVGFLHSACRLMMRPLRYTPRLTDDTLRIALHLPDLLSSTLLNPSCVLFCDTSRLLGKSLRLRGGHFPLLDLLFGPVGLSICPFLDVIDPSLSDGAFLHNGRFRGDLDGGLLRCLLGSLLHGLFDDLLGHLCCLLCCLRLCLLRGLGLRHSLNLLHRLVLNRRNVRRNRRGRTPACVGLLLKESNILLLYYWHCYHAGKNHDKGSRNEKACHCWRSPC